MKKSLLPLLFALIPATLVFPQTYVLAVSDFTVASDKADYKYLGKGVSRLVASELRKSGRITLVEREQLNKILEEQELNLSDLTDASQQVRIGNMLSAAYLVVGEIIDMGTGGVLVSVRMVNVETGAVMWQDEKQEHLGAYDYMGAYFAASLLGALKLAPNQTTVAKLQKKEVKEPEAIIKTSEGIDAFDRKDTAAARQALERAQTIDPANNVAAEYLAKLVTNTVKFKTLPEPFYPDKNPAYLGIMRSDNLYISSSWPVTLLFTGSSPKLELPSGEILWEHDFRVKMGYAFPVSGLFGLDIQAVWFGTRRSSTTLTSYNSGIGGMVNAGFAVSDAVSLGLGITVYAESNLGGVPFGVTPDLHPALAGSGGLLVRNADETIVYDLLVGYGTGRIEFYDSGNTLINRLAMPLFVENTFTFALNRKRTFILVKQLNDIAFDRPFYHGRIVPAFEQFITDWFSLRLGLEGSLVLSSGDVALGYGVVGGLTLRIIDWGLDVNLNLVYRLRPSKIIEEVMFPDFLFTISLTFDDLFVARSQ